MFRSIVVFSHRIRRGLSRSEWTARLLRLPFSKVPSHSQALLMIQIDGLSLKQMQAAQIKGHMPFLERLCEKENYITHSLYSGLPSSTPAVQGELFYGVKGCVPEFSFLDRKSGKVVKMYEEAAASAVEQELQRENSGLLHGGSSYSNIFTGGAAESHFCAANLGWDGFFHAANPLVFPILFFLYIDIFLRTALLLVVEFFLAVFDFLRGVLWGRNFFRELKFIPTRVAACVLLRELVVAGAAIDMARGLPIIHLNLIGYDEQSHQRGPSSLFAHWSLRGIDNAIERLWTGAHRSNRRDYDVWIYSDHGQENVLSYNKVHDTSLQRVIDSLQVKESQSIVVAMGPVGIVYLKPTEEFSEIERLASTLVSKKHIPYVFAKAGEGQVHAWSRIGKFILPNDAETIFGPDHPFLKEVSADLVHLCHHPDAGDLIVLGWARDGTVTTFIPENGTHAGPGINETGAFALLPVDAPISYHGKGFLRPIDLREGAQSLLGRSKNT